MGNGWVKPDAAEEAPEGAVEDRWEARRRLLAEQREYRLAHPDWDPDKKPTLWAQAREDFKEVD